jgi:hypothetical protein
MSFNENFTTEKFYNAKGEEIRKLKTELEQQYSPISIFLIKILISSYLPQIRKNSIL